MILLTCSMQTQELKDKTIRIINFKYTSDPTNLLDKSIRICYSLILKLCVCFKKLT